MKNFSSRHASLRSTVSSISAFPDANASIQTDTHLPMEVEDMNSNAGATFAQRVKTVIGMVGSVSEIARRCGFSEGVVRSWRDGHTDPSRARCVTMAKTLGISLVWLVAGEGSMEIDGATREGGRLASRSGETYERNGPSRVLAADGSTEIGGLDADRLASAVKLLKSNVELAGGNFELPKNADLLGELYDILGQANEPIYTDMIVAFNHKVGERIRSKVA